MRRTDRFAPRLMKLVLFFMPCLLDACASAFPQTHHLAAQPVEIRKLFVTTELGTENSNLFASVFTQVITDDMQSCGINVKVENVGNKDRSLSLAVDPYVAVNANMKQYGPDSIMMIRQQPTTEISSAIVGIKYNVVLIKLSEKAPVWNGVFRTGSDFNAANATALAQSIANKLKEDSVVQGCANPTGN